MNEYGNGYGSIYRAETLAIYLKSVLYHMRSIDRMTEQIDRAKAGWL